MKVLVVKNQRVFAIVLADILLMFLYTEVIAKIRRDPIPAKGSLSSSPILFIRDQPADCPASSVPLQG